MLLLTDLIRLLKNTLGCAIHMCQAFFEAVELLGENQTFSGLACRLLHDISASLPNKAFLNFVDTFG
jgi:hypothetical protein